MRILSVEILCSDLNKASAFYGTTLGLPIHLSGEGALVVGVGSSRIIFRRNEHLEPHYHLAFNIPENQTQQAREFLRDRTTLIPVNNSDIVDFPAWNAESIYFFDAVGNILEFIARHDLKNTAEQAFTVSSILSLSEVAVVTASVRNFCDYFTADTGIEHYEKQPPHENFAALGDAEGLLIVSRTGRNWFPTNIISRPFPVRVTLNVGGKIKAMTFNEGIGNLSQERRL